MTLLGGSRNVPAPPPVRYRGPRRWAAAGAVAGLVAVVAVVSALVPDDPWHDFFGLRVYHGAAQWWVDGRPLYDFLYGRSPYGFTYPPFAAILVAPMAALPVAVVAALHAGLNLAVLGGLAWWLVGPVARRHGRPVGWTVAAALPVFFLLEPVRDTLGYGQVNLLLAALVLADVAALRRGSRWAGVGTGLAAAIKLTPALFVVYLLVTRRWRAAAVATGTAAAATLLAAVVAPGTSWQFFTDTLWHTERVGRITKPANQSLLGALARLTEQEDPSRLVWAVLVVAVLAVALTRAVRAARAGDELVGVTITGLAACLVSPITWTHHLVWMVPALVVLVDVAAGRPTVPAGRWQARVRGRAAGLAVVLVLVLGSSAVWYTTPADGAVHLVASNAYLLLALVLVAVLPARVTAARAAGRSPGPVRPGGSSPR
ncbi:glycosyltransferase 87 family protein [Blastococcus sp. SYSU D00695]